MPSLTFWTAKLFYPAITADVDNDLDITPQTFGISASVLIIPFIKHPPPPDSDDPTVLNILAPTLLPNPAMVVLAPTRARLDSGWLMLRAEPDMDVDSFPTFSAFPATGVTTQLYRDVSTDLVWGWNGSAYVESYYYAPVRLVSQTPVLSLPEDATLGYTFEFSHVTYNQAEQHLPSFSVQAPTTDVVIDLSAAPRISRT